MTKNSLLYITTSWLPLALVITALSGVIYVAVQQDLRTGANDPQIQMAEDTAALLQNEGNVFSVVPDSKVNIESSLAPFVVVFDEGGALVASSALLHGEPPTLPSGVLEYARKNGENRISWQPEPGVRHALVIVRYGGAKPGFVAVGRSLREVEAREAALMTNIILGWLVTMASSLIFIVFLSFFRKYSSLS
jgi:hypothetical protein